MARAHQWIRVRRASAARLETPMRDLILFIIIAISIPISFFRPYFGILMWTWITFFNPHRYTWGFMYNFPVAAVIAVPTLVGCLFRCFFSSRAMRIGALTGGFCIWPLLAEFSPWC